MSDARLSELFTAILCTTVVRIHKHALWVVLTDIWRPVELGFVLGFSFFECFYLARASFCVLVSFLCVFVYFLLRSCQYQCNSLPEKTGFWNAPLLVKTVKTPVKPTLLAHSFTHSCSNVLSVIVVYYAKLTENVFCQLLHTYDYILLINSWKLRSHNVLLDNIRLSDKFLYFGIKNFYPKMSIMLLAFAV